MHLHVDARVVLAESPQQGGEDAGADALEDADAQRARRPLRQCSHIRLGGVELRDDRVRVPHEQLAGLGEPHRLRPARPDEQSLADDALELPDLLADRRLRVPELARRTAERLRPPDRLEGGEMADFEAE